MKLKTALTLLLLSSFGAIAHCEDVQTANIGPFGTLNNYDSPIIIGQDKAQDLLNVDISPGGTSVKKREGYSQAITLSNSTSATHGVYKFFDSSGNDVILIFNDTNISASINGNMPTVLLSTGPNGVTYQCIDSQGYAYCNNTARTTLYKTDGAILTNVASVNSTGTMVAVTPVRLVISGFAGAPNRIDFSQEANFTRWVAPFSADTDPNQITITAPGSRITHITYAFNRIMWFKDNSFGYVLFGPALLDWQVKTISPTVGSLDNASVYWNDVLYWRAQDGHFYSYDGSNIQRLSRDITTTLAQVQNRLSASWTQTTLADFQAGITTPTANGSAATVPGSIILTSAAAISPFVDTTAADFIQGTLTHVSTDSADGFLTLTLNRDSIIVSSRAMPSGSAGTCNGCGVKSEQFLSTFSAILTSVSMNIEKLGSPGNYSIRLMSDSSGSPGSILVSSTIPQAIIPNISSIATGTVRIAMPPYLLAVGTTYWIQLEDDGGCTVDINFVRWYYRSSSTSLNTLCDGTLLPSFDFGLVVKTGEHESNGNIVSRIFDTGFSTSTYIWSWAAFLATGTIPSHTTLTYETQTSTSATGIFESLVSVSTNNSPTSTVNQFIRYKASFATNLNSTSSILNGVQINMTDRLAPYVTFYSQVHNETAITSWDTFDAGVGPMGSHTFSMRSATNTFSVLSATPTWVIVNNGAIPSISTGTYLQVRDVIVATAGPTSPQLNDFTVNWFEGQASDKIYGGYFNDAIWWNVQSASGTYNDTVIRYDLLNNGFVVYDIPMNGFYARQGSLYFGSSNVGKVYKYGGFNNDNGNPINAYWKSKDFIVGSPFEDTEFTRLSLLASAVESSTISITYEISAASATSYNMSLLLGNSGYRYKNVNLPAGRTGTTFNLQFGNFAEDQPFEVFGAQYGFRKKPWIPKN